jgi:hypothetical protein
LLIENKFKQIFNWKYIKEKSMPIFYLMDKIVKGILM